MSAETKENIYDDGLIVGAAIHLMLAAAKLSLPTFNEKVGLPKQIDTAINNSLHQYAVYQFSWGLMLAAVCCYGTKKSKKAVIVVDSLRMILFTLINLIESSQVNSIRKSTNNFWNGLNVLGILNFAWTAYSNNDFYL